MSKLIIKEEENVLFISLNNPKKRNALDAEIMLELTSLLAEKAVSLRNLKAIVLSGEGNSFCAGADLNWMKEMVNYTHLENIDDSKKLFNLFNAIYNFPLPVIAKVKGHVYGGGLGLLAASDYVLAEEQTKFCFSEVKLGLAPAVISSFVLSKCNTSHAQSLMTSAIIFDTNKAIQTGLVNDFLSDESFKKVLLSHKDSGQEGLIETKKLCLSLRSLKPNDFKNETINVISKLRTSSDAQIRMNNFLENKK